MEKKIVVSNDELIKEAEILLIRSGNAAKGRTKNKKGYVSKEIKYQLKTGKKLVKQIKEIPYKWEQWVEQTRGYLIHDKADNKRPTIHRMDSDGNYQLNNIEFLPFDEHMARDNNIATTVYDLQKQSINLYATSASTSDVLKCSGATISRHLDSGLPFQNRYLIQAEGKNRSKNNDKAEREMKMLAVANVIIEEFDDSDKVIRSFPAQLKSIVSFPKLEIRRQGV